MKRLIHVAPACSLLVALFPAISSAQTTPAGEDLRHCTSIGVNAGVVSAASERDAIVGASLGWRITPRVAIEGRAAWSNPDGAEIFAGALSAEVRLISRRSSPYVKGGIGLYRAAFDLSETPPDFYARRIEPGALAHQSFVDPSVVGGAGFEVFATRRISLRPEVEAVVVLRDWRRHVAVAATVQAVYHFEYGRVTPARGRWR
jgi:hypothetical protein